MGTFFYGLSNIFPRLIDHSVEISLLICLIFFVKMLAPKRLPSWWHYCLWLMLLVRMLVPVEFENRLNLFNFVPEVPAPHVSEFISEDPVPPQIPTQPVMWEVLPEEPTLQIVVRKSLPIVWLTGAMILVICVLFETITFWLSVRRKPTVTDEAVLSLLSECKSRMKIRRNINIVVTDNVRSPALFGYLKPRLLLPEGVFEKLSEKELSYAFMHELGHLKRHDIGVSWLVTALQVVHWFNPLVWLAFYQLRIDQESACDAAVLARMKPKQSAEYAKAIVGFLEKFCQNCQLPSLAGVLENRTQMKRRLARIVQYRKTSIALALVSFILLSSTALVLFSLTGVAAHNAENDTYVSVQETGTYPDQTDTTENPVQAIYGSGLERKTVAAVPHTSQATDPVTWDGIGTAGGENGMALAVTQRPGLLSSLSETGIDTVQVPQPDSTPAVNHELYSSGASGRNNEKPVKSQPAGNGESVEKAAGLSEPSGALSQNNRAEIDGGYLNTGNPVPSVDGMAGPEHIDFVRSQTPVVSQDVEIAAVDNGSEVRGRSITFETPMDSVAAGNLAGLGGGDVSAGTPPDIQVQRQESLSVPVSASSETEKVAYGAVQNKFSSVALAAGANRQDVKSPAEPFQAMDVDTPPRVIKSYPPRYPYMAKRDDISGSVVLQFVVTKDGNAVGTTVVESQPEGVFDETALQAIEQYRFKPGVKDGKAVDVKVHLPIKFTLS